MTEAHVPCKHCHTPRPTHEEGPCCYPAEIEELRAQLADQEARLARMVEVLRKMSGPNHNGTSWTYDLAEDALSDSSSAAWLNEQKAQVWDEAEAMFKQEVPCTCHESYKSRGCIAPDCFHYAHGIFAKKAMELRGETKRLAEIAGHPTALWADDGGKK